MACQFCTMPGGKHDDECPYDPANTKDDEVTTSCGCVFCDLKLEPTRCTDGWFHLLKEGRTIPCPVADKEVQPPGVSPG
jgi:hypothetical protein